MARLERRGQEARGLAKDVLYLWAKGTPKKESALTCMEERSLTQKAGKQESLKESNLWGEQERKGCVLPVASRGTYEGDVHI